MFSVIIVCGGKSFAHGDFWLFRYAKVKVWLVRDILRKTIMYGWRNAYARVVKRLCMGGGLKIIKRCSRERDLIQGEKIGNNSGGLNIIY